MRLGGGVPYDGDPPTMSATGNDYAELCDLGPTRWSSRGYYHVPPPAAHSSSLHPSILQTSTQSSSSAPTGGSVGLSAHHIRAQPPPTSSYEAEDIGTTYGMTTPPPGVSGLTSSYAVNSRIGNSTSSLRTGTASAVGGVAGSASGMGVSGGRPGLYYSPPGTSYTIIERPHSPHYYYNSAGVATKGGSLPGRGSGYLSSSPSNFISGMSGTLPTSSAARHGMSTGAGVAANGNKKRPISPEQVLRMFGATQSSSVPTSSYHYSNGTRDRTGRRSPASSPPSTTHQVSWLLLYNLLLKLILKRKLFEIFLIDLPRQRTRSWYT